MHGIYITLVVIYEIIKVAAILHVIMDNRQPVKTMAWALVIYFVPIAGIVLYIFFGINTRREKLISQRSLDQLTKRTMLEFVEQCDLVVPQQHQKMIEFFINDNSALPFKNNNVDIFTTGHDFFLSLIADMGKARHHIHIDIYIFENDALGRLVRDVLIDKASEAFDEHDVDKLARKARTADLTLEDFLDQMQSMKKMGGIKSMLDMIPGMQGKNIDVDENAMKKPEAIIRSMTPQERRNPGILNASRRKRIAAGSGTTVQDVNQLIRQFDQAKQMMKQMTQMKGKGRLRMRLPRGM